MDLQATIEAACALVDREELADLVVRLVDTPSPTGQEAAIARVAASWLDARGVSSAVQHLDDDQANALGRVRGTGRGGEILLYAPLDTVTVGDPSEDVPGVGDVLRDDLRCEATRTDTAIRGLGASNPKGHAAAVMAATAALASLDVRLPSDVIVGLGAGGMPTNRRPGQRRANTGQGVGCSFMIEQGLHPDAAIIAKPGWTVAWEEVGLCWFRVVVRGTYNYVGSRHRLPYRNAIVDAARLVAGVEAWLADYGATHQDGLVAPQGQIGWIEGGWERMPAFSPASCAFLVDLRISPRTRPQEARRDFQAAVQRIADDLDVDAEVHLELGIPGTSTDPDHPIIAATRRAWERVAGRAFEPSKAHRSTSGATDANILRERGIPTARVGMDRATDPTGAEVDFAAGMNTVGLDELTDLVRVLIGATVEASAWAAAPR